MTTEGRYFSYYPSTPLDFCPVFRTMRLIDSTTERGHMGSAERAELLHDAAQAALPSPGPFMDQAREEIIEKILEGESVDRIDLETILDGEIDRNYRSVLRSLYEHFAGIDSADSEGRLDRCANAGKWMKRLVESFVDQHPDMIHERACQIADDSGEE